MNGMEKITADKMIELLSAWQEIPMAHALTTLFLDYADTDNLWFRREYEGRIYAPIRGEEHLTMSIRSMYGNRVDLEVYEGSMEYVSNLEYSNISDKLCAFIASDSDLGTWAYGMGNLRTYSIKVLPRSRVSFPSPSARWLFDFLHDFSVKATELHLDVSDQPRFWDGVKKDS